MATHTAAPPAALPARTGSTAWAALASWPIAAVFMLGNFAAPLYVLWQQQFGFSKGTLTAIFCWYMVGLVASLLVSGVVSDRLGRKAVLLPAMGLALVAAVVFATAGGVAALSIARVLLGLSIGALVSAGTAAVTDLAGTDRRRQAALLGSVAVAVGTGFGPLWAGILSETLPGPTSTVFWLQIALLLTATAVIARMPLDAPAGGSGAWIRIPRVPAAARRNLLAAVAVAGPGLAATSFMLSLAPSLLAEQLGTDDRIIAGSVAAVAFASSIAAQLALRGLSVVRLLLLSAACTVVSAALLIAAVQTAAPALLLLSAVFAGPAQGLGLLGGLSMLNQAVPTNPLAEANAALNISAYALVGALSLGLGHLADAIGLGAAIDDFAFTLVALTLIGLALMRWARR
ncbi:MFS transporter [Glycomyces dulcitolivorans]|uniref:MFS transporter n=1 Tax=Glycomyces dulcitolivorans TaxID=2200759 RepID=UPI000DD45831|nr:MFS transporter [Glycomyces dulcitolivorans]